MFIDINKATIQNFPVDNWRNYKYFMTICDVDF